jgi:hypothetical protein
MAKAEKVETAQLIKARCLQRFSYGGKDYKVNDVYQGEESDIETLTGNGFVDAHKDAVAHAESLK